jgi:trimethylguanosine synthase
LPNGDCGDGIVNPYPKDQVPDKFWSQRRRLFTRFDEGIQLDKESWYSVTPEAIANHITAHLVGSRRNVTILDPFCGCGGNAIAFACREEVDLVVCVDTDLEKLKKAASNAQIYGISKEKMVFIHDNAIQVLSCYKNGSRIDPNPSKGNASVPCVDHCEFKIGTLDLLPKGIDMIFLSPPWGGMDYGKVGKRNYDLTCIKIEGNNEAVVDGESLLDFAAKALGQKPMALFLPRNINGIALGKSAFKVGYNECPLILEQNILNGKLKTVTAYLGLGSV